MIRVDLHIHTSASFDCQSDPVQVAKRCRSLGLAPIFVTDHDSIEGALRMRKEVEDVEVVIGQEITTTRGELIGLFLNEAVPGGLEPGDAVREIKAQGGLVYLEHPYDASRRRLQQESIEELADEFDIVEVWNERSSRELNERAKDLALTLGVPFGAGSDAHRLEEIGSVHLEMADFEGPEEFLRVLADARIVHKPKNLFERLGMVQ
ncbi:MAG TPA: PHP domain-containing protein [Candidatus Saccharimonadales bacterium]|nr:PHP domain-containing protein [Candidatus Saccharimonadales bacterium]